MDARVVQGWLMVPYKGHDLAQVFIGLHRAGEDTRWYPAFLDYYDGNRIAKIRVPESPGSTAWGRVGVLLRISDRIVQMGSLTIQ